MTIDNTENHSGKAATFNKKRWLIVSGAAALIGTAVVSTATAKEKLGKCVGANTCKGQSSCATAKSECAGRNDCKGKGWINKVSKADCAKKGGKFKPLKKK